MTFRQGGKFEGFYANDSFKTGFYEDPEGNIYRTVDKNTSEPGYFKDGRLFGFGRADYATGERYIGYFKDGKRSGKGKMIY